MPRQHGPLSAVQVEGDFVEADLDAAFALVYFAEERMEAGALVDARRAVEDADAAMRDGQWRLQYLDESDSERFGPRLERMRTFIERVRAALCGSPGAG